jgi:hypothetical protein
MPVSREDFEIALDALADPSVSDADAKSFLEMVEQYETEQKKGQGPGLDLALSQGTALSGLDALDAHLGGGRAEEVPNSDTVQPNAGPQWKPPATSREFDALRGEGGGGYKTEIEVAREQAALEAQIYNDEAKTLSKLRELDAPAEYLPEGASAASLKYWAEPSLREFRDAMREPLAPKGKDVDKLDEKSFEYAVFADKLWKQRLAQAIRDGEPIARTSGLDGPRKLLGDVMGGAAAFGLGYLGGATAEIGTRLAPGAAEGLGAADDDFSENIQNQRDRFPISDTVGMILGIINPLSVASWAARGTHAGLQKLAPGVLEKAGQSWLGRATTAGVVGATTAVGEGAVTDAATVGGELLEGDTADAQRYAEQIPDLMGQRALFGAGLGAAGDLVGALAGRGARAIETSSDMRGVLGPAERAGVQLDIKGGVRLPPLAEEYRNLQTVKGTKTPQDTLVADVREPYARAAADFEQGELGRLSEATRKYYEKTRGQTVPVEHTAHASVDELRRRMRPDTEGKLKPGHEAKRLQEQFELLWDVDGIEYVGLADDAAKAVKGIAMGFDEAKALGVDLEGMVQRAGAHPPMTQTRETLGPLPRSPLTSSANDNATMNDNALGGFPANDNAALRMLAPDEQFGRYKVVLKPAKLDAQGLDDVLAKFDDFAGHDPDGRARPDEMWELFARRARQDREKFPAVPGVAPKKLRRIIDTPEGRKEVSGWAALKSEHDEVRRAVEGTLESGGLPKTMPLREAELVEKGRVTKKKLEDRSAVTPKLEPKEMATLAHRLKNYAAGDSLPENDKAIELLMEKAGLGQELDALRALNFGDRLEQVMSAGRAALQSAGGGLRGWVSQPIHVLKNRSLPMLRKMAEGADGSVEPREFVGTLSERITRNLKGLLFDLRAYDEAGVRKEMDRLRKAGEPAAYRVPPSAAALRGGVLGGRAGAAAGHGGISDDITFEDLENLLMLMEVHERARNGQDEVHR